jgi:UDP-glucose 4-epimerase
VKVLVTGGAGFIGSHVCQLLTYRGHEVVVLDNFATGLRSNIELLPVTLVEGSVTALSVVESAMKGVEAVAHLAALGSVPRSVEDPQLALETNTIGTLTILEASRMHRVPVIFASSSSVYGSVADLPRTEDLPTRPISPYGASKLAAEALVLAYGSTYNMRNIVLRFFNVYGPRQRPEGPYAAVIPRFINAALAGNPIDIHGSGEQSRDFTYVETVAQVVEQALTRSDLWLDKPVNLAFGSTTSINQIASLVEKITDVKLKRQYLASRPADITASTNDPAFLREIFPGVGDIDISDGLRRTCDWFAGSAGQQGWT